MVNRYKILSLKKRLKWAFRLLFGRWWPSTILDEDENDYYYILGQVNPYAIRPGIQCDKNHFHESKSRCPRPAAQCVSDKKLIIKIETGDHHHLCQEDADAFLTGKLKLTDDNSEIEDSK